MAKKSRRSQEGFISENESNTAPAIDGEIKVHSAAHKVKLNGTVRTTVNLDEAQELTNKDIDGWENKIENVVSTFPVAQVGHGFAVGEGIYYDGLVDNEWKQGQANTADTLAYFVVIEVVDVDNFRALDFGRIQITGHGFDVGKYYFLSETTPGLPVLTIPNIGYSNPLFFVEDANILQMKLLRPDSVGAGVTLDQIDDVSANSPLTNEILTFDQTLNGGLGLWVPKAQQTHSIDANTDVNVPTPSDGDVLTFNSVSGKWEAKESEGGGDTGPIELDALFDVDATTPANNEVLTFNSTTGLWEPQVAPGAGGGEVNVNSNAGAGEGTIAKTKSGVDTPLKSIKAGANITINNNADEIEIIATDTNTGEVNTNSNVGGGEGTIAKTKVSSDTPLKTIKAGANITVINNANEIEISGTASYVHPNHTGDVTSTGDGAQVLEAQAINGQTLKATPVAGDHILIADSEAGNILKKAALTSLLGGGGGSLNHVTIQIVSLLASSSTYVSSTTTNITTTGGDLLYLLIGSHRVVGNGTTDTFVSSNTRMKQISNAGAGATQYISLNPALTSNNSVANPGGQPVQDAVPTASGIYTNLAADTYQVSIEVNCTAGLNGSVSGYLLVIEL